MYQPVYPVVDDDLLETLEVEDVGENERAVEQTVVRRFDDVGQDDVFLAVVLTQ